MNILIIHQYFLEKQGAGGSRFNQFAKYWADKGHKITIIAGTVDYATGRKNKKYKGKLFTKEKIDKNITVFRCYVSEAYNKNFLGRLWAYFSFTISSTYAGLFLTKKQDILVATSPPLFVAIPAYIISKLKKISLIFEIRDLWPKFAIDTGVIKNNTLIKLSLYLEKWIYKKADLINVLTPAFKEYLISKKNVPREKIIYIPNAADLDLMKPGTKNNWVRKKYNWENKFVILYVGAHGVANDLWQIIDVAETIRSDKNILFALVGDGMEKPKLKKEVQNRNLKNIQFIDPVPKKEIVDFINASDICTAILKPIFTTTYPNKIFDYMACSKPIILPIDGACRELVINDAKAGIFVEPKNQNNFKKTILTLEKNPQKCKNLGQNGYKFVIKNFDRKILAKKYLKIISEITKQK